MKRSSKLTAGSNALVIVLLATALPADEPAKKTDAVKPPWQRLLQGADAKKAAEQEKKLTELQEAGQFAEALKVAEALAELRAKTQGANHWEAVNARFQIEAICRVMKANEEAQQSYRSTFAIEGEAKQLRDNRRYREAQPLFEQLLVIRRKVLGEEHPDTVVNYENIANCLDAQGKYREAEKNFGKALAIRYKVLGDGHFLTAQSYRFVALNLYAQHRYKEAEEGFGKALTVCRKVLGEQNYYTAASYHSVALNLQAQHKYKEAEEGFGKALAIWRQVLGEQNRYTAVGYDSVADNLQSQGKFQEAEDGFRKALTIRRKMLGEQHAETAKSYQRVAANLNSQGKYQEAEVEARKALAICRRVFGEQFETAKSYISLAGSLDGQCKYKEAAESFCKALDICRTVLGEQHAETARSYAGAAGNLMALGKCKQAEEGFRKALAICRNVLGEEHPQTAQCYNQVASCLAFQGKTKEAEASARKALAISQKVLGEDHPETVSSYESVAGCLTVQGKFKEAEVAYRKALAICSQVFGEDHRRTAQNYSHIATTLSGLRKYREGEENYLKALAIHGNLPGQGASDVGLCYCDLGGCRNAQGKYKEAEISIRKGLAVFLRAFGAEHPYTARSYYYLSQNLNFQGKYREAEAASRNVLPICRKLLGEDHPDTFLCYCELAYSLYLQGKYREGEIFFLRGVESFNKARLQIASVGLERSAFTSHSPLPMFAAVLARNGKPEDAWQRFEESLARGTWDDLNTRLRRPQAERDKLAQISLRIDRLQKLIERVSVTNPRPEQIKERDDFLSQLREAYGELASFTQQLEKKYGPVAGQVLSRAQIQKSLPQDAALIAWLDIEGRPTAANPSGEHWAILLRSVGGPNWVRLSGSGDKNTWTQADTQLPAKLRDALQSPDREWQPFADRLREQRLQPLAQHLQGVRRLIVLPSTAVAGAPVEVIADGYTVSDAHSGSMYVHLHEQRPPSGAGLLALADPVFQTAPIDENPQPLPPRGVLLTMVSPGSNAFRAGLRANDVLLRYGDAELNGPADFKQQPESSDAEKLVPVMFWRDGEERKRPIYVRPGKLGVLVAQEPAPQAVAKQRRLDRVLASRGGDESNWVRLPGTRIEASSLQRLFGGKELMLLLDSESSERQLNELAKSGELGKYRYVHLATHGEVDNDFPLRSAVILSRDHLPDEKQRSELLVSSQPIPDGRLTAEEALQRWNLDCDLVTLSACQTARGKYEHGEGFVGFAQALVLCGTRSVCLSLWKVNDTATALLMERFYKKNLLGKRDGLKAPMPKAAALTEAKAWLRTLTHDEAIKHVASLSGGLPRGKGAAKAQSLEVPGSAAKVKLGDFPFAHPYYWAAFILTGDPG